MRFFVYTSYFFYLAGNWGMRIAMQLLREEIYGEKKYGIHTTGADELKALKRKGIDISHATIYMPASYALLEKLYAQINPSEYAHFLDLGCGKGRALCVAAHAGFKKMTGIELSKALCKQSIQNLEHSKLQFPNLDYRIINNDAYYFDIEPDVDCIFMFNPFDEFVMVSVSEHIQKSLDEKDRKITIIYLNSLYKHIFLENGFREIYHTENLTYLQASILEYDPK